MIIYKLSYILGKHVLNTKNFSLENLTNIFYISLTIDINFFQVLQQTEVNK